MIIAAADPGLAGAFAVLDDRKGIATYPMPLMPGSGTRRLHDLDAQVDLIKGFGASLFAIEDVTRPAKLTRHQGFLIGVALCAGIKVVHVRPQAWKAYFNLHRDGGTLKQFKGQSIAMARSRFGREFKTDGEAEAALIALFAKENAK